MKSRFLKKIRKNVSKYLSTNRLFLTFVVFCMIETMLIRNFTIGHPFSFKPFICDLALIILIGSFGYLIKPKKQFRYFFIWMLIVTTACIVNSIYFVFYTNFASFGFLAEIRFMGEVGDSVVEKFKVKDFIYLIFPTIYFIVNKNLKFGSYFHFVGKVEKGKKMFFKTLLFSLFLSIFTIVKIDGTDASRLVKQWNREYIVQRFGIVLYQSNDLVQSLIPKINSLFGYDEAAKTFKAFYAKKWTEEVHENNKYTDVLKGMNIVFVHMESIQSFYKGLYINGVEISPTLNKLSREGMYFTNFYPQISIGTSSDTEFTLNTSLMPANSGTVFGQYWKREYVSIPSLLSEQGYYTFSSHANAATMWNRDKMHPRLGYQEMYFKDSFDVGDETDPRWVGLGLNDVEFFKQLQPILEKIETEHEHYMGTLIQLSNHSPFAGTSSNPEVYNYFGELDLTNTYTTYDSRRGEIVTKTDKYLEGTKLGNYLISAHYGDMALGTFIDYIEHSDYYENTVFVFYGDHDARLDKKEYQYFYNYNIDTGELYEPGDPEYVNFDYFANEVNKRTPLIIWTKNKEVAKKIKGVNNNVMGMYDVLPTLGNMMGFEDKYALGHDIYDIKDNNVVIFPNGNFVTNKVYYNASSGNYMILNNGKNSSLNNIVISEDYISNLKKYTEERLDVSNDIIVHDLIKKEGDHVLETEAPTNMTPIEVNG